MEERSFKDKESVRKEVIQTKRGEIVKVAEVLDRQLAESKHFVVGGARQTKDISKNRIKKIEK